MSLIASSSQVDITAASTTSSLLVFHGGTEFNSFVQELKRLTSSPKPKTGDLNVETYVRGHCLILYKPNLNGCDAYRLSRRWLLALSAIPSIVLLLCYGLTSESPRASRASFSSHDCGQVGPQDIHGNYASHCLNFPSAPSFTPVGHFNYRVAVWSPHVFNGDLHYRRYICTRSKFALASNQFCFVKIIF